MIIHKRAANVFIKLFENMIAARCTDQITLQRIRIISNTSNSSSWFDCKAVSTTIVEKINY